MVSIMNTNKWYPKRTHRYQNYSLDHIMIFGGYVEVRESLYTRVIICVNNTLNQIDTRTIIPRYEGPS